MLQTFTAPPVNFGACLNNRALALQDQNRLPEALATINEAIRFTKERVGPDHMDLSTMLSIQSDLLRMLHKNEEARASIESALAIATRKYPRNEEWPQYIIYMYGKMQCDTNFGEYEEGMKKLQESLRNRRPNFHPTICRSAR